MSRSKSSAPLQSSSLLYVAIAIVSIMYRDLSIERRGDVFILTLQKPPENRLTSQFCQEIIRALNDVLKELGPDAPGAVIIRGNDAKFFCTVCSFFMAG